MSWKDRFTGPIQIKNISELNVGDFISWAKTKNGSKRYAIITRIEGNNAWGNYNDSIEMAKKKIGTHGSETNISINGTYYIEKYR
jgi:hypothetical protein